MQPKANCFSARLHYPVDVVEITGKLNHPIGVAYTKEVIYVSDLTEKAIFFLDLKGNSVYDPDRMTIKQLQKALKDQGLWENKDRTLKKADLQQKLQKWIKDNQVSTESSGNVIGSGQKAKKLEIMDHEIDAPAGLCTIGADKLIVSDLKSGNISMLTLTSNGLTVTASTIQIVYTCIPLIYNMVLKDNYVYFASSDLAKGGIFSIEKKRGKIS
ncbi:Hypothetical predicted protein [Mytilus galloprovincialis]|uniref:Uncharacterized protein n=1 Tax=Mytilus galloprovincialis TaxID=29158 RepID=A0A8B6EUY5_MYTGA|nr:Hypothetical predicted protein [Mytilus galloprovincialis]